MGSARRASRGPVETPGVGTQERPRPGRDVALTDARRTAAPLRRIAGALPWWVPVVGVYLVSRAWTAGLLLVAAAHEPVARARWWPAPHPPYDAFVGRWWDGWWYGRIAAQGYPPELPYAADGTVAMNEWAFFPLYPLLGRGVMELTGAPWETVAPTLSLVLGAAAVLVVDRLVRAGAPRAVEAWPGLPLASVAVLCAYPAAVVLQTAYTESLALLLVATSLLLIVRRSYLVACLPVLALGLTRSVAAPLAVVVVVHAWTRLRAEGHLPRGQLVRQGTLLAVTLLSAALWPLWVARATGTPDAFVRTQEAWRDGGGFGLFAGWGRLSAHGTAGLAVGLIGAAAVTWLLTRPAARRLGAVLLTWLVAYLVYLAAVTDLISSIFRFTLLAFPLAPLVLGLVTGGRARRAVWCGALLVVLLAAQAAWVWTVWRFVPGEDGFFAAP